MSEKTLQASFDEKTKKPIIELNGEWIGKDIKLIIKMLPRAYRLYRVEKLKNEAKTKQKGVANDTGAKRREKGKPKAA